MLFLGIQAQTQDRGRETFAGKPSRQEALFLGILQTQCEECAPEISCGTQSMGPGQTYINYYCLAHSSLIIIIIIIFEVGNMHSMGLESMTLS